MKRIIIVISLIYLCCSCSKQDNISKTLSVLPDIVKNQNAISTTQLERLFWNGVTIQENLETAFDSLAGKSTYNYPSGTVGNLNDGIISFFYGTRWWRHKLWYIQRRQCRLCVDMEIPRAI